MRFVKCGKQEAVKKKITIVLVSTGIFLLGLFALLPTLLSSDHVLGSVLSRINAQSGTSSLKIANCDIGWLQGPVCSDVDYLDTERGLQLKIEQMRGSQGLLALLAAPKNFGTIWVRQPVVTIGNQTADTSSSPDTTPAPVPDTEQKETQKKPSPALTYDQAEPPFWDALVVSLVVEEGKVIVQEGESASSGAEGFFSGTSSLAAGTVKDSLQWVATGGNGKLLANGFINLPARQFNILETLVARMELQVSDLQLAPLLAIAARRTEAPSGSGLLNGELTITGAGTDNLDIVGSLDCADLELSGGFLGADHPRFQKISLGIDGSKKGRYDWRISRFDLKGDPGRVSALGEYGRKRGRVGITGSIHLPVLFTQLPHLFHVQQGASLTRGELKFSAELSRQGDRQQLSAGGGVDVLQGVLNNQPFTLQQPLTLAFAGELAGGTLRVKQLELTTPYLKAKGKGTRTNFSLQAEADLETAGLELGKLFALQWTCRGNLELEATSRLMKESRYGIDLQAKSSNLVLSKDGEVILPEHPMSINGSLTLPETRMQGKESGDLQLEGSIWPGTFLIRAENLKRAGTSITTGYDLTTRLNLERLSGLLHNLQLLPPQIFLAGDLKGSASGFVTKTQVALRELDVRANDFIYKQGKTVVENTDIVLQAKRPPMDGKSPIGIRKLSVAQNKKSWQSRGFGLTTFDWLNRKLSVRDLQLRSALADFDIKELVVDDLKQPLHSWRAELQGRADTATLSELLPGNSDGKKDLRISGQSRFVLSADQQQGERAVSLDLMIPDCRVEKEQITILNGEEVSFSSRTTGLLTKGDLGIDKLDFRSPPVSLQAAGMLQRTGGSRLILEGEQKVDFARVGALMEDFFGKKITIRGSNGQHFSLDTPLAKEGLKSARLTTDFQADTLVWSGVEAERISLPLKLEDGVLNTGMHGTINGGRLNVDATYFTNSALPHITIPSGTQVLAGVQLDRTLTEAILEKIHPLFGVLASPTGTIDARVDAFYWPVAVGGSQLAKFTTVFDVGEIKLDSRGVLKDVLALMKLDDQPLTLKESEITCTGKQGRISCTPLHILVADSVMTISGSVGMDQSLEYLLEVPVTEKLIGREGFRVLNGATIRVPLRGTLNKPDLNTKLVSEAIADLARQAADKAVIKEVEQLLPDLLKGLKL